MKVQALYVIGLDISNHEDYEHQVAHKFAEEAVGLKPGPLIGGTYQERTRVLAVARLEADDVVEIHILRAALPQLEGEGFVSHGYWETGMLFEWDDRRDTTRTPVKNELAELDQIKARAKQDGARIVKVDSAEARNLVESNWSPAWLKEPAATT